MDPKIDFAKYESSLYYDHYIYLVEKGKVVKSVESKKYKLGKTDRPIEERLKEHKKKGKAYRYWAFIVVSNSLRAERTLKQVFKDQGLEPIKVKRTPPRKNGRVT